MGGITGSTTSWNIFIFYACIVVLYVFKVAGRLAGNSVLFGSPYTRAATAQGFRLDCASWNRDVCVCVSGSSAAADAARWSIAGLMRPAPFRIDSNRPRRRRPLIKISSTQTRRHAYTISVAAETNNTRNLSRSGAVNCLNADSRIAKSQQLVRLQWWRCTHTWIYKRAPMISR